jgi:TolB-like protein/tetratricopeptide (TPR) repeat protein
MALTDRYQIERELGHGGMATVYLAQDLKHHRHVAIKVLRPELAAVLGPQRFLREIEIAAGLRHPQILPVYDSGDADGLLYYVMPFVEGESLRDRLKREKQVPLDDALQIIREVADALTYSHGHDVVHRDIKPENILLESGHAVVADFGIARAITAAGADRLTETGLVVGTPAYMSPEQATGADHVDGRSDVYSLACVLYEMLTGDPPFTGSSAQAILARKAVGEVLSVRSIRRTVPEGVERALERALAASPADRFPTIQAFAAAVIAPVRPAHHRVVSYAAVTAAVVLAIVAVWTRGGDGGASARLDRLAVLPFANLTGSPEQQHFVDAMHDAVIAELSQIGALTVISRQSVLRYRETQKSVPEIARELGVDVVVQGSVFRAGDTVRITAQLLQARPSERHLGSQTFQRNLDNVLALHGEVARAIAGQIEVVLTPGELRRLTRARPVNPAAYEAWLRGWVAREGTGPSTQRCIGHANEALAIDSGYAAAYALAAGCYNNLTYVTQTPAQDAFPKAKAAALRAIEIDPSLGEAHTALAWTLAVYEWDWSGADRAFREAIRLGPGTAATHLWYGFFLAWLGRHDEAMDQARRAEELSPGDPVARQNVAVVLYLARRYDEAIAAAKRTIDLAPNIGWGYDRLANAYEAKKMYSQAVTAWEQAARLIGGATRRAFLARAYALAGRQDDASRVLGDLLRLETTTYVSPVAIASVYIGVGQLNEAIAWLERGYDRRDGEMVLLKTWPVLDPIRPDPRFQRLLRRMNFPQ